MSQQPARAKQPPGAHTRSNRHKPRGQILLSPGRTVRRGRATCGHPRHRPERPRPEPRALGRPAAHPWAPRSPPSAARGEARPPRPRAARTAAPHNALEAEPRARALPQSSGPRPRRALRRPRSRNGPRPGASRTAPTRPPRPSPRKRDGPGAEVAGPPAASRTTVPVRLRGAGRPRRRRAHGVRGGVSSSRTLLW